MSVRCTGGAGWRMAQAALFAVAAAALAAWLAARAEVSILWGVLPFVLVAAVAWRACRQRPTELNWDGQHWRLDTEAGPVDVMVDLGNWMLLRWRPAAGGSARWPAVCAADAGPALHALRSALHAHAGVSADRIAASDAAAR